MDKRALLKIMKKHGACDPAYYYVLESPHRSAEQIGLSCDRIRIDWLIWLLAREGRLVRFTRVATKRSFQPVGFWNNHRHGPGLRRFARRSPGPELPSSGRAREATQGPTPHLARLV